MWLHRGPLLGDEQVGGSAMSPLRSQGPPKEGTKSEVVTLPLAFSRAHKWAELPPHRCVLGSPQKRGQNQRWLHCPCQGPRNGRNCYAFSGFPIRGDKIGSGYIAPCLLGGPHVGRIATPPMRSWGSPEERITSEVATSSLPSQGRNYYVAGAFSVGAMRQRILGSHTPPCHRRMVITT